MKPDVVGAVRKLGRLQNVDESFTAKNVDTR